MLRHWPVVTSLVLVLPALSGCGCDDSGQSSGQFSGQSSGQSSRPTVSAPAGSPFQVSFTGPEVAEPGQTVTAMLTNTGRLPDKYQFESDPANAATISPFSVELAPGQSVTVQIEVQISPLIVNVADASAGLGGSEASISIGSTS